MRADVEEAAARNLWRPHVAQRRTQVVQVAVVIGLQLAPAVVAIIEIVKKKNVPHRIESAQRRIGFNQGAAKCFRRRR
jgi:hypothetical protein